MKIFRGIIFVCFSFVHAAMADEVIVWSESGPVSAFSGLCNRVLNGVILTASSGDSNITVMESMTIENYGEIRGNLVANNDDWIRINNVGNITGTVVGPHIMQLVTSGAGARKLNIDTNDFFVKVDMAMDGVNLVDVKNLGSESVEFNSSVIVIDDFQDWQDWDANVSWMGANVLQINDSNTVVSGTYVRHVGGGTILNVLASDIDNMYRIDSVHDENGIMLNVVRETDYQRIFNDNRGAFLGNLRAAQPNDKMLLAMDRARNMDDLQNVMNSAYHFNSGILMRPVKTMHNFAMIDNFFDGDALAIGIEPLYITSKDTNNAGVRVYTNINHDDYSVKFNLHFNKFDYEDDINVFGGLSYGAGVNLKRKIDNFSVAGQVGIDLISFDADNIYSDGDVKNNPSGYALYGGIDGIYDYYVSDNVIIAPFIGGVFQNFQVLEFSENDFNLRGGGTIKYNFTIDGIKYEYGVLGGVTTNADLFGNIKIGFESLNDYAGASMNIGAYKDERSISYRISLNANVSF